MIFKKTLIWTSFIFLVAVVGLLLSQPLLFKAIMAKYKSTDHFLVLAEDSRIKYEAGAKANAITLSGTLDESIKTVEQVLNSTFPVPIEVYICSSQEAFNEYVFISKNVRGAVYWGKLFLSPGAFNRGSLTELTAHELTHYLFYSHIGERAHIAGVPLWFREGIAVFVANGGAEYTAGKGVFVVMRRAEREAYLSGAIDFWFTSQDPLDAVTKNGVANWLLYRVSGLFVHFIHDLEPNHFGQLTEKLLSGMTFNRAIELTYGQNTQALLGAFTDYLKRH